MLVRGNNSFKKRITTSVQNCQIQTNTVRLKNMARVYRLGAKLHKLKNKKIA